MVRVAEEDEDIQESPHAQSLNPSSSIESHQSRSLNSTHALYQIFNTTISHPQPTHHQTTAMAAAPKSEMQRDMDGWVARASATAKDPSGITAPTGTAPWSAGFFSCFAPIDLCAITCCCPCITFGKTHHRLHKDASLAGYSVVNASVSNYLYG